MPSSKEPLSGGQIIMLCVGSLVAFLVLRLILKEPEPSKTRDVASGSTSSGPTLRTLSTPNGSNVILFRSKQGASDAMAIISAGGSSAAWSPYVACIVSNYTQAVRLGVSFGGLSEVVINDGPQAGCRGWVPMEFAK